MTDELKYHTGEGRYEGRVTEACDNVLAWRLGDACNKAAASSAGDLIDRGLALIHTLRYAGFEIHVPAEAESLRAAPQEPSPPTLAPKHQGMKVDYSGLLKQSRNGLRREPALAEMLRQFTDHLTELGTRFYAGEVGAVDEFLQLYCIASEGRAALAAQKGTQ